jgi:peptidoglycan hydrolase-like protein with peptidoglycan-binding domain
MRRLLLTIVALAAIVITAGWIVGTGWLGASHTPALSRDDVRQAQHRLRAKGFYDGPVDGVIGPQTTEALRRYQRRSGLAETAELDAPTQERLVGAPTDAGSSGVPRSAGAGAGGRDSRAIPPNTPSPAR